jgi:hypothetical protein
MLEGESTHQTANIRNGAPCDREQHRSPGFLQMQDKEQQASERNEQAGEKPGKSAPISDDHEPDASNEPGEGPESKQNVTEHDHLTPLASNVVPTRILSTGRAVARWSLTWRRFAMPTVDEL